MSYPLLLRYPTVLTQQGAASGPTLVVQDDYVAGADITLASRVPDTLGTGYTWEFGSQADLKLKVVAASSFVQKETGIRGSQRTWYSVQPGPTGPDQEIEMQWVQTGGSSDDPIFLILRANAGDLTDCYMMRGIAGGMTIHKIVGGVVTQLKLFTGTIGNRFRFRAQGTDLKVFENDVEITAAAVSDNSITQTGRWGLGVGNFVDGLEDVDDQALGLLKCWNL